MTKEIVLGKQTKNRYRFESTDDSAIGNATIYLSKASLSENGMDRVKGFEMVIVAKE